MFKSKKHTELLAWDCTGGLIMDSKDPEYSELFRAIAGIPPGSTFLVQGSHFISQAISFWELIQYFGYVLKRGLKCCFSHCGIYFGSGNRETVESFEKGVGKGDILDYFKQGNNVAIWSNSGLSVQSLQNGKDKAYSLIGKKYDIRSFLAFLISADADTPDKYICTEAAEVINEAMGLEFVPGKRGSQILPIEVEFYFQGSANKGWIKRLEWRGLKGI